MRSARVSGAPIVLMPLIRVFLLDLGDIVGYSLVADKPVEKKTRPYPRPMPDFMAAEIVPPRPDGPEAVPPEGQAVAPATLPAPAEEDASAAPRRSMSFRRRR